MSSFCKCKSYSHFFSKNISIYPTFNDQIFNDTLTNDIISFEQLGPDRHSEHVIRYIISRCFMYILIFYRCIGSNQHLKNKYGSGYMLEVKLATKQEAASLDDRMDKLHQYILNAFPASSVMEQFSERVQYKVPKSSVTSLSRAFTVLEDGN